MPFDVNSSLEALKMGGVVIYPLVLMAVGSLVISIDRFYCYLRWATSPPPILQKLLREPCFSWTELEEWFNSTSKNNYFVQFIAPILIYRNDQPTWWLESKAIDEAHRLNKKMAQGLWILETIVTSAPLLGLLGTILGMMHAFSLIGGNGLNNPAGITGGVAQSLIATALGIFIALLSLLAFNYFSHRQVQTIEDMERLGTVLIDQIKRTQEMKQSELSS